MPGTMLEEFTSTPEGMASYQQERAILAATILLRRLLREQGLTKSDLANRLNKSKSYVTQLLDGRTNMTLRTLSDVMLVLGKSLHITAERITLSSINPAVVSQQTRPDVRVIPMKAWWKNGVNSGGEIVGAVTASSNNSFSGLAG